MEITAKDIKKYYQDTRKRHAYYEESVEKYEEIDRHVEGEDGGDLINKSRPNETEAMKEYRVSSFEPLTKPTIWRVLNSMQKIRKSKEWAIKFNAEAVPARVTDAESPQRYLSEEFPKYGSVEEWFFSIGITEMLTDANAFVAVHPSNFKPQNNEYLRPIPIIYNSDDVYDYVYDEYFVMESGEKNPYTHSYGKVTEMGAVFYVYTKTEVVKYGQINTSQEFAEIDRFVHNLGYVPCFQMKGVITEDNFMQMLCESRISPMIPYMNDMIRMQSDFKYGLTAHCYPTRWYYASQDCNKCNGTGAVIAVTDKGSIKQTCPQCEGHGGFAPQIGKDIIVKAPEPGANPSPTPPGGDIPKDFTAIKELNGYIDQYNYKALSAINFQFLDNTPLNTSGLAKEVDRDELNVFVHSVAKDGAAIIDFVCKSTIDYRYSVIVPSPEERYKMMPTINVPDKFDLMSANSIIDEIKMLKEAGADASIINAAQIEYAAKAYSTDPMVKDRLIMKLRLDPYAGVGDEALITAQQFGSVNAIDVRIHYNIGKYIDTAIEQNKDFNTLGVPQQKEIIKGIAIADTPEPVKPANPLMP